MLKLDPDQRFDISQVVQLCQTFKQHVGNKPTVDIYLIMDDIIEKLSLLDYETAFCRGWKHKRISRIHFAHVVPESTKEQEIQRVHLLYDMVYWLMSMDKEKVSFAELLKKLSCVVPQTWCIRKFQRFQEQDAGRRREDDQRLAQIRRPSRQELQARTPDARHWRSGLPPD
jgi:hypothetical protein